MNAPHPPLDAIDPSVASGSNVIGAGCEIAAERRLRTHFAGYQPGPAALLGLGVLTYLLIQFTWVFFRAKTFTKVGVLLCGLFGLNAPTAPIVPGIELLIVAAIIGGLVAAHWLMRTHTLESVLAHAPAVLLVGVWAALAFAIIIEQGAGNVFIYFQF
jgi:alginate O-acetyltransferase complex protein AlgI